MKSKHLAIICMGLIGIPGGVFAADCTAAANVVIAKNLAPNWRMLKVVVISDSCETSACNGSVLINIEEHLPRSSDGNSYQFSLAYDIMKGSRATSFNSTRRFGSDAAQKPIFNVSVDKVSCFNR